MQASGRWHPRRFHKPTDAVQFRPCFQTVNWHRRMCRGFISLPDRIDTCIHYQTYIMATSNTLVVYPKPLTMPEVERYQHKPEDLALWERLEWAQWPDDRPRPTEEEYKLAAERYRADCNAMVERGYTGDGLCGLKFVMMTFARPCWWHYFFPDEQLKLFWDTDNLSFTRGANG